MKRTLRIIFRAIVCLWMVSITPDAFSQETYKFDLQWGSQGTGEGQFDDPVGVAVDSSEDVYVADSYNHRIQKFDPNGSFINKWGSYGTEEGQFIYPQGVAVDSSGNVYVADFGRIQKFDSNGNFKGKWLILIASYCVRGIAADLFGDVYITTGYCCFLSACPIGPMDGFPVLKFDSNGNLMAKWGDWGTGDGQFSSPGGVAVDSSGNVYVVDRGNNCIQKFDSNGNFISKWGITGIEDSQFFAPYAVSVDSAGDVYVSDAGNNRIQKFDSSGNFVTKWGYWGQGEGQFDGPGGMAVDSSGDVYVADTGNQRIQKFYLSEQEPIPLPDLTGKWVSLIQRCRNTMTGTKCMISGRLNIQNIGSQNAASSLVRYYLSNDPHIGGTDILLGEVATGSLKIGISKTKTFTYNFPVGETVSGKYIIAVIDAANTVTESNKSNNDAVFGPIQ